MTKRLLTSLILFATMAAISPQASAEDSPAGYRHVVLFQFKDSATPDQIAEIEKAFAKLPEEIDAITGYEWGTNVSPEGLDTGLTHCFLVTFADKAGLETYLPHPAHKAFVEKLKPILEKAVVLDYVPRGE